MKKAFLSAAAVVAVSPCRARRRWRRPTKSRSASPSSRPDPPRRSEFRTERARLRAEGVRRRADQAHRARRRRRRDRGNHQRAAVGDQSKADIIMGSSTTPPTIAVSTVAKSGDSALRSGAVPDQRSARQVVDRHAAADPDHGQGALRAHEGARHQERRLHRLLQLLRRPLGQRLQGPGRSDGPDARHRRAFRAPIRRSPDRC